MRFASQDGLGVKSSLRGQGFFKGDLEWKWYHKVSGIADALIISLAVLWVVLGNTFSTPFD